MNITGPIEYRLTVPKFDGVQNWLVLRLAGPGSGLDRRYAGEGTHHFRQAKYIVLVLTRR